MKNNWWILLAGLLSACHPKDTEHVLSQGDASCAFISSTADGRQVISWVETAPGADTGMLYFAVQEGDTFSTPHAVTPANNVLPHAENMPKLVFKPGGEVIAMYGIEQHDERNKYAGRVYYTHSMDAGKTWSAAQQLVTDTSSYDQRYFDMALLPDGEAATIWLDNRKDITAEGSTLYFAKTNGHDGFKGEQAIAETACQCCRTDLYTDPAGNVHIAFRDIINDSIRDMVHLLSVDKGATFSAPARISADNWVVRGCPHTGPAMAANDAGLHCVWFTMGGGQGVYYCRSADNGKTYSRREGVSVMPMAKHPQIAAVGADKLMIVWDEPVKVGKEFNSRVGYQVRKGDGVVLKTGTLTSDSLYVTFPVVKAVDKSTALVAYTKRMGEKSVVCYRWINL
jgi:hypothetical protein